jgi:RNA polymerase sigma-70 factor (ECF subfamily)
MQGTETFEDMVHATKDKALSLAVRMLGNRDHAEDALQDAYVSAFRSWDRFRGDARVTTWFFRIVYNTCLNALDRQRRLPNMEEIDEEVLGVWTEPDALEQLENVERDEVVQRALESMPPLYASIMDLFYVQECSYEQIVAITGMPLGTVKTRLNRGRTMLRDAVLQATHEHMTGSEY